MAGERKKKGRTENDDEYCWYLDSENLKAAKHYEIKLMIQINSD